MIKGPGKSAIIVVFFALVVGLLPVVALPLPYEGQDWLEYGSAMYVPTPTPMNVAPTNGIVIPSSGSGPAGTRVYFTTTWRDGNSWQDLKQCYFHIGASPSIVGNVTLMYNQKRNKLWLRSDNGLSWTGGCAPGTSSFMSNSQVRVYCADTVVGGAGDTLTVLWAIAFDPSYTGDKKTGLKCKDAHKAKAKGQWKGTWTIEVADD
jgi:hypothetical protein